MAINTATSTKTKIEVGLKAFQSGVFAANARRLFDALGYSSEKTIELESSTPEGLLGEIGRDFFNREKAHPAEWKSVDLLFQLTDEEVRSPALGFDSSRADIKSDRLIESYIFLAIELKKDSYTRTALADITREINRLFPMPALVLFKHGATLTLSVINRRLHKRDAARDVLEKVTLIKDIRTANPHRAHVEILADLALTNLAATHRVTNFVELHDAWRKTLDSSELNKRFYKELANWYFWALPQVEFPESRGVATDEARRTAAATNTIRLITRLVFVWFLKERELVPRELFQREHLAGVLKSLSDDESTFYKAILQNLFFATLNTPMDSADFKRDFIKENVPGSNFNSGYMVSNYFRYKSLFKDPEAAREMFAAIPFLNGGLFECLDKREEQDGKFVETRVDGFSEKPRNQPRVPNHLFFADEQTVDLSESYGDPRRRSEKVRGLINLLNGYKFTVAENTPIEEEVALDPELLGKVFENLLASYNPETGATARKQTGSFYTPREIVNYMVDESLIAYLETQLAPATPPPAKTNGKQTGLIRQSDAQESFITQAQTLPLADDEAAGSSSVRQPSSGLNARLRHLFAYNDEAHGFAEAEVGKLILAIDAVKILDPACGSGAFPVGILQKLVFILAKLDARNERWKQRQIDRVRAAMRAAEAIEDHSFRENAVRDLQAQLDNIEEAFGRNELDYGRKLFLIENCIYGVDIQPIAIQISKLRFFISLIVDQKIRPEAENLGVRPLPNLETKFVAANALLGIEKPAQGVLQNQELKHAIEEKERELKSVRERHFTARTTRTKEKYRGKDEELRGEIGKLLERDNWSPETTAKLVRWSPYDQNATADFFDAEWMFGLREGFDVVIGNPPYLRVQGLQQTQPQMLPLYRANYQSAQGSFDLYALFIERGYNLLDGRGQFSYIVPHKFFQATFGNPLRQLLGRNKALRQIVRFGSEQVFDEATTYTCLLFLSKQPQPEFSLIEVNRLKESERVLEAVTNNKVSESYQRGLLPAPQTDDWDFHVGGRSDVLAKLRKQSVTLGDITRKIFQGIATSADKIFVLKVLKEKKDSFVCYSKELEAEIEIERGLTKPFLMGKDVHRYESPTPENVVVFPYKVANGKAELMTQKFIRDNFPLGWKYLLENKQKLMEREHGRFKADWHSFSRPQNLTEFEAAKIMTPEIALGCQMSLDTQGTFYHTTTLYSFVFKDEIKDDPKYFLGVLNSKVLWYFLQSTGTVLRGGYFRFKTEYLKPFPIPCSLSETPPTESQRKRITNLVDQILAAKRRDAAADVSELEREIDKLVYRLYELTDDEINIVEGKV